ncbi:MAG TPA: peptidyl-prolyl cis-trans isomerase [Thermoanaerobaculia bacterium]|nr:peptidyl-prolyl cis-trans isomerase [Thermoanaerobaculia bacterium]
MLRRPITRASLLAVLLLAGAPGLALHAEVLNGVVLRVNDHIATLRDYQLRKQAFVEEVSRRQEDPVEKRRTLEQAGEIVFKDMYDELLLQSRADQLGVEVTTQQVDAAIQQMREGYNLKTDEEFRAALAQSGLSEARLREQMRGNLRLREVMSREVNAKVQVEEDDVRRYYNTNLEEFRVPEQVQLREVVVLETAVPDAARRSQIAAEIRAAVAGGQTLEQAIESYKTLGQTSGAIDLGWVSPGDLDPALESAAWKVEKGGVSEPVAARGGLHLIQVSDRTPSRVRPFTEVAQEIQRKEEDRLYREEMSRYMVDLQRQALIVADPPAEAAGFRRLLGTPATGDELSGLAGAAPPSAGVAGAADSGAAGGVATPSDSPAPASPVPATPTEPGAPGGLPEPDPVDNTPEPAIPPPGL